VLISAPNIVKVEISTARKYTYLFIYLFLCILVFCAFPIVHYVDQPMRNVRILTMNFYIISTATCIDAKNEPRHLVQQNMQI
jgi:hypothetical protein